MTTELLAEHLRVLFIGFNPSPKSAETGWNYAGPNNRFYRILYEAGLTDTLVSPSESRSLLPLYQYGFTNLVQRPTPRANDVSRAEYKAGALALREKLASYQPDFACFVGRGVYESFAGQKKTFHWGFQTPDVTCPYTQLFVGPGTSGLVRMTLDEQVKIYRELAQRARRAAL